MDNDNAKLAAGLRRQMNRRLMVVLGFSLLGLGMPLAGGFAALVLLARVSILHIIVAAIVFMLVLVLAAFGLMQLARGRIHRALALIAVADELGMAFQAAASPRLLGELQRLEMFGSSSGIGGSNVLTGSVEGLMVTVMDCIVTVGEGTQTASFENSVFLLRDVPRSLPNFYLVPHDFFSRTMSGESSSVEIPRQTNFNKRFLLQGEDKAAIRRTFNVPVIELCLAGGDQSIEVHQSLFVVRKRGKLLPPARYPSFVSHCIRLAKSLGISATA